MKLNTPELQRHQLLRKNKFLARCFLDIESTHEEIYSIMKEASNTEGFIKIYREESEGILIADAYGHTDTQTMVYKNLFKTNKFKSEDDRKVESLDEIKPRLRYRIMRWFR